MEVIVKIVKVEKTYERDGKEEKYFRYQIIDGNGNKCYVKPLDQTSKETLEDIIEDKNDIVKEENKK